MVVGYHHFRETPRYFIFINKKNPLKTLDRQKFSTFPLLQITYFFRQLKGTPLGGVMDPEWMMSPKKRDDSSPKGSFLWEFLHLSKVVSTHL